MLSSHNMKPSFLSPLPLSAFWPFVIMLFLDSRSTITVKTDPGDPSQHSASSTPLFIHSLQPASFLFVSQSDGFRLRLLTRADNPSLSTASPLLTRSPLRCSPHQPPGLRNTLGLFSFSLWSKTTTAKKKGKRRECTDKAGIVAAGKRGTKGGERQGSLNLRVRRVFLEEQVTRLEKNQKRTDEVGRPTRREPYGFTIFICWASAFP